MQESGIREIDSAADTGEQTSTMLLFLLNGTVYRRQALIMRNKVHNASYESAVKKLDEFNSYIVGNDVIAEDSGVVTEVPLEEGDGVTKIQVWWTLYDASDVTMEITVSEDGYKAIDQDGKSILLILPIRT